MGGFNDLMFAYLEDTELSLRAWIHGLRCRFVADSVVLHDYSFASHASKMYLLERNRLLLISTLYERRTLVVLSPAILGLEIAILLFALRSGWARQKVAGYLWLFRHRAAVRQRRNQVQGLRRRGDSHLAALLTGDFSPGSVTGISPPRFGRVLSR